MDEPLTVSANLGVGSAKLAQGSVSSMAPQGRLKICNKDRAAKAEIMCQIGHGSAPRVRVGGTRMPD